MIAVSLERAAINIKKEVNSIFTLICISFILSALFIAGGIKLIHVNLQLLKAAQLILSLGFGISWIIITILLTIDFIEIRGKLVLTLREGINKSSIASLTRSLVEFFRKNKGKIKVLLIVIITFSTILLVSSFIEFLIIRRIFNFIYYSTISILALGYSVPIYAYEYGKWTLILEKLKGIEEKVSKIIGEVIET